MREKFVTQNITKLSLVVVVDDLALFFVVFGAATMMVELGSDPLKIFISSVKCWPHFVHDLMPYRWGSSSVPKFMKVQKSKVKIISLKIFKF